MAGVFLRFCVCDNERGVCHENASFSFPVRFLYFLCTPNILALLLSPTDGKRIKEEKLSSDTRRNRRIVFFILRFRVMCVCIYFFVFQCTSVNFSFLPELPSSVPLFLHLKTGIQKLLSQKVLVFYFKKTEEYKNYYLKKYWFFISRKP